MSPCDFSEKYLLEPELFRSLENSIHEGYFRLEKDSVFQDEMAVHAREWQFTAAGEKMDPSVPVCFIGGSRDEATPSERHILPLAEVLRRRGVKVDYLELDDSHDYPASRFRVAEYVVRKIREMESGQ